MALALPTRITQAGARNLTFNFSRVSLAYTSDGLLSQVNFPRLEKGAFYPANPSSKAIMLEEGTTNLVPNSSFETDNDNDGLADSWNVWVRNTGDSTRVHATTRVQALFHGTYAQRVEIVSGVSNSNITSLMSPKISVTTGQSYTASAYVRASVANKVFIALRWEDSTGAFINETTGTQKAGTSTTRLIVTGVAPSNVANVIIQIQGINQVGEWMEVDAVQLEAKPYATSFIDGTRAAESLTIPTAGVLNPQEGEISIRVYVPFVINAGDFARIWQIPGATATGIALWYRTTGNWELRTHADDNTYTTGTAPVSLTPTGWHLFSVKWTTTQAVLYIDGVARVTINNPKLPSSFAANAYIGSNNTGGQQLNTLFDDLRISNRARTDAEIAVAYNSGLPLPVDEWTTYKLAL